MLKVALLAYLQVDKKVALLAVRKVVMMADAKAAMMVEMLAEN